MRKVMVDNWLLEDIILEERNRTDVYYHSYSNLLMSILLWDEVLFPKNTFNWWISQPNDFINALTPYDDLDQTWEFETYRRIYDKSLTEDDYEWMRHKGILSSELDIIEHGAKRYLLLSGDIGCDYLPCLKRQEYLKTNKLMFNKNNSILTEHLNIEQSIEKEIQVFFDFFRTDFEMPILSRYIIENTPFGMTPVEYALHLKNEGPVVNYRNYLNKISDASSKGDFHKASQLIKQSKNAIEDVIGIDKKSILSVKIEMLPIIFWLLGLYKTDETVLRSLSISFDIKEFVLKPKANTVFIKDLSKYALSSFFSD